MTPVSARVGIVADPSVHALQVAASRLADQTGLPVVADPSSVMDYDLLLAVTPHRLEIRQPAQSGGGGRARPLYVDLQRLDTRSPAGRCGRQPLRRAIMSKHKKGQPLAVVDATAGFGSDTWLLASMGCRVTACERCATIGALLADGLRRAKGVNPVVADRIHLVVTDACQMLDQIPFQPDVVYIDTMFPPKRKHALEPKPMRMLRQIVGVDSDSAELLAVARRTATGRVVVKRPLRGEPLAARPVVCHKGKSVRYDVYTPTSAA